MDFHRELINQANADLKEMEVEPDPSKRAWLGGRAQVLLSVANFIKDDSPSAEAPERDGEARLSKVAESVKGKGQRDDAQYEVGKIAGLNLVRRLLRTDATG